MLLHITHTQDGDIPLNVIGDAAGQRNLPSTETHTGACACAHARTRPHPPLWRHRRKFTSNHHTEAFLAVMTINNFESTRKGQWHTVKMNLPKYLDPRGINCYLTPS